MGWTDRVECKYARKDGSCEIVGSGGMLSVAETAFTNFIASGLQACCGSGAEIVSLH